MDLALPCPSEDILGGSLSGVGGQEPYQPQITAINNLSALSLSRAPRRPFLPFPSFGNFVACHSGRKRLQPRGQSPGATAHSPPGLRLRLSPWSRAQDRGVPCAQALAQLEPAAELGGTAGPGAPRPGCEAALRRWAGRAASHKPPGALRGEGHIAERAVRGADRRS